MEENEKVNKECFWCKKIFTDEPEIYRGYFFCSIYCVMRSRPYILQEARRKYWADPNSVDRRGRK